MSASERIREKLGQVPHRPGVYLMKDRFGTVIYVGKARDLHRRVSQYFQASRRMGWDLKFNALVEAIHDLDVHVVRSEPEALLLEGRLIKEFQPRYNISFRDDKRFLLLKVNLGDPIPRFTLTRLRTEDGSRYFGPFPNAGALRRTLNLVRQRFNLRGCRPLTPGEPDYRHCLYAHMKVCTAPCIGNVTRDDYLGQVKAACDFLDGECRELSTQLQEEMRRAATQLDFEKAAQLRDLIADLSRTTQKTTRFERTPWNLPVAIMPERDNKELGKVLGLPGPPVRIEGFDISNISGTFKVASVVSFRDGRPDRANYRRMRIKTVEGQNDFACMGEAVRRRYARLLREQEESKAGLGKGTTEQDAELVHPPPAELRALIENRRSVRGALADAGLPEHRGPELRRKTSLELPDLIVVDGGKGQLGAALEELERLGLCQIAVIGIAKEFEEIYRPGQSVPMRLPMESNALKLLQRIRDESHRVANSYNAQLRLRRISESLLDEFPGIGATRKAALLKRFGSVQRLSRAAVGEIAEVPGFGGKVAAELLAFLGTRIGASEPDGEMMPRLDEPPSE
jgi:excinuclease ABC subunit C